VHADSTEPLRVLQHSGMTRQKGGFDAPGTIILFVLTNAPKSRGSLCLVVWAVVSSAAAPAAPTVQVSAGSASRSRALRPKSSSSSGRGQRPKIQTPFNRGRLISDPCRSDRPGRSRFIGWSQYGLNRFDGYEFKYSARSAGTRTAYRRLHHSALQGPLGALWSGATSFSTDSILAPRRSHLLAASARLSGTFHRIATAPCGSRLRRSV